VIEMTGRTLVACLGNIFLGDDGFGVEVARRLASHDLPEGVRVTDYGIRGMHLAYDLAEGFDTTILVDAAQRGGEPGTVYVIEPEPAGDGGSGVGPGAASALGGMGLFDAHGMQPDVVLDMAGALGAEAGRVLVVGCEPANLEEGIGLSPPVAAAVDEAVRVVTRLVTAGGPRDGGTAGPQEDSVAGPGNGATAAPQEDSAAGSGNSSTAGPLEDSAARELGKPTEEHEEVIACALAFRAR
jgi:hydrogenase maturation protease